MNFIPIKDFSSIKFPPNMTKAADKKQCTVCPRPGKACSRCNCSFYCSKECQKVDWPLHRTLCASFEHFKERPSLDVRRAIHFPVKGSRPEFVWLSMNGDYFYNQPNLDAMKKSYFGGADASTSPVHIYEDLIRKSKIRPEIMLTCGMFFAMDNSPLNECIYQLGGKTTTFWKGPAVAYGSGLKLDENREEYAVIEDLDTTDLTGIINHVLGRFQKGKQMQCVKVASYGNMNHDKSALRLKSVALESTPTFVNGDMGFESPISRLFGMPLVVILTPADNELDYTTCSPAEAKKLLDFIKIVRLQQPSDSSNMTAGLLMIGCGGKTPYPVEFGKVPERFTSKTAGDAIVVRRDGKPLVPAYLEAFCNWIKEDLYPVFSESRQQSALELSRSTEGNAAEVSKGKQKVKELQDKVLDKITRARFYAWCNTKGIELKHY
ncbi:hypothetical protein D6D21_04883 [Aureobasidium pullulans]|uniref:MYND-type domain-containing protein n=1 Tax=Aureobasidium pullulans TaxID=5580 RepID=A0AB74IZI9_AURPU|nr:hypothetical protein D6D21_04883 [Aureobasidium pullulans]